MKKFLKLLTLAIASLTVLTACVEYDATEQDQINTYKNAVALAERQPTPTDIDYSLERYNLIRRTYWVNGKRERAIALESAIPKPMGYIVLFSGNTVVGKYTVDGKVSSLNSFLTADSEYYEGGTYNEWLADVDGSYGENDSGIFFFTPDGNYIEWSGDYLYSDIPMNIDEPVVKMEVQN